MERSLLLVLGQGQVRREIGTIKIVDVGEWIELAGCESFRRHLASLPSIVLRRTIARQEPIICVKLDLFTIRSSQEPVHGQARCFAQNIPKCNVHRADRAQQRAGLAQPIHIAVQLGPEVIDPCGILTHQPLAHMPAGRFHEWTAGPIGSLANAG